MDIPTKLNQAKLSTPASTNRVRENDDSEKPKGPDQKFVITENAKRFLTGREEV
ncbi:MAG: hypothetical protein ACI9GZ_002603 [Bacteroidia bacterium]